MTQSLAAAPPATTLKAATTLPRLVATPLGQASQCRAQCAQTRYTCTAQLSDGDGGDCNIGWSQCVVGCGGSTYRFSDTAPTVFGERAPR